MTLLGIWLLSVSTCDLLRATRDQVSAARAGVIAVFALAVFAMLVLAAEPTTSGTVAVAVVAGVGLAAYVVASAAALTRPCDGTPRRISLALAVGTVMVLLLTSGRSAFDGGLLVRWYDGLGIAGLSGVPLESFLLGAGLFLFQLASANVVVRVILNGVGVPAAANERTMKGGRLLGPMERVFILGLGMAGYVTAASVVIAAKGLLRFPELQASSRNDTGASELSEYFLVGSFLSWLIAMAGLPLLP
jgi:hypothetical protein